MDQLPAWDFVRHPVDCPEGEANADRDFLDVGVFLPIDHPGQCGNELLGNNRLLFSDLLAPRAGQALLTSGSRTRSSDLQTFSRKKKR